MSTLLRLFLDALPAERRDEWASASDAEPMLRDVLDRVRLARPAPVLSDRRFLSWLAVRAPPGGPGALHKLHVEDLYLACACVDGFGWAHLELEARCFGQLGRIAARFDGGGAFTDELVQHVRTALIIGDGRRPKLEGYGGLGSLESWVRGVAVRAGMNLTRRGRDATGGDALLELAELSDDLELANLKAAYRTAFREAFRAAVAELPAETVLLLKQYYFDELTLEQLARFLGVHTATAGRRLEKAREMLWGRTRAGLAQHLSLSEAELDSVLRLVQSKIEISRGDFG
jgi:RNA polymerase sigma-70 factor (ECF subfamily)